MDKKKLLNNFENEYYSELENLDVSLEDLKKFGVTEKLLSSETYLYSIYGDEIVRSSSEDDVDGSKKKITKLGDAEKSQNSAYLEACRNIEDSEFDKNLETLIGKL